EELDFFQFYQACDPLNPLKMTEEDEKYYINFAEIRRGKGIEQIRKRIEITHRGQKNSSSYFFTGHIGGGKSTELARLEKELSKEDGYHVIYFTSDEELNINNVELSDILLLIAHQITKNLESKHNIILEPPFFKQLLIDIKERLQSSLFDDINIEMGLPANLAKISAKIKTTPVARSQLREYIDTRTDRLIESLNKEILEPALEALKTEGKKGLVVIVDNLERIADRKIPNFDFTQQEYIFINQGDNLTSLNCHVIYTIPLALLMSSKAYEAIQRLGNISILPMIPVQNEKGETHEQGLQLLRQMVMARAFPQIPAHNRLKPELIQQIFTEPQVLTRLCQISGGHVRQLLQILQTASVEEFPISPTTLERAVESVRGFMTVGIKTSQWEILRKVSDQSLLIADIPDYEDFFRQLWILEYANDKGVSWYDVNPLLKETEQFQNQSPL
ncbi:MAG: ATP-binding protein, partial [Xenococcus sp. (in: cyanobacteria)]